MKSLTDRARSFIAPPEHPMRAHHPELEAPERRKEHPTGSEPAVPATKQIKALMEYWIYAPGSAIPRWEDIQDQLAKQHTHKGERERAFNSLESMLEKNNLTIDYVLKQDAKELFDYPEDLIPLNSRISTTMTGGISRTPK